MHLQTQLLAHLLNVCDCGRCVEGRLDTYGTQGRDFTNDLVCCPSWTDVNVHASLQCPAMCALNFVYYTALQCHVHEHRVRRRHATCLHKLAHMLRCGLRGAQLAGGPTSKGFRKANLTPRTRTLLEEVALSEQVGLADVC